MNNSEEQSERAGFDTLSADQKARMEEYQQKAARARRIQENADEMLAALHMVVGHLPACLNENCGHAQCAPFSRVAVLIRKIEGDGGPR